MWLDGEKVKNLTKIRGWKQDDLANIIGVARQTVCQWLNHKQPIAPKNLMVLAKELQLSPVDIVENASLFCAATRGDKFARAVLSQESRKAISDKTWSQLGTLVQSEPVRPGELSINDESSFNHVSDDTDGLLSLLSSYIAREVRHAVASKSLDEVSKETGLLPSQIELILHGKADMRLFPLGALIRLCPQLVNHDVLDESPYTISELNISGWLHIVIDRMTDAERSMTKMVIQTTMPRFLKQENQESQGSEF